MKKIKSTHRISNKKVEKMGDYFTKSLSTIFKKNLENYLTAYIKYNWKKIIGEYLAKRVFFIKISQKHLQIYSPYSTVTNEIKALSDDLISKVNAYAGKNLVEKIDFRPKPFKEEKETKEPLADENKNTLKRKIKFDKLTNIEKEMIKKSLSKVKDKDLKNILKKYRTVSLQKQNYRRDNLIKCKVCGEFSGSEFCTKCQIAEERNLKTKIIKLLTDLPYLSFADVQKEIPRVTPDMLNKVRVEMVQRMARKINGKDGVNYKSKCLTMLYRSMPPEFITDAMVLSTLKKLRFDLASPPPPEKNFNKKSNSNLK